MAANRKYNLASPKLKVAILEDNRFEIVGMVAELTMIEDIEVVKTSADPDEVVAAVREFEPDVVFIDLKIQGDVGVGITVIREIKAMLPAVKCVVLTAFPDLKNFLAAFDAGAEGFVRKDATPDQQPSLADLCRMVVAGGRYYDPDLVGQMRTYLDVTRLPSTPNQAPLAENPLTGREQEVLARVARHEATTTIAAELFISENTVKTHIGNIKSKLGAKNRHEAVLIAMSRGWLSSPAVDTD